MQKLSIRRILVSTFLVLVALAVIMLAGAMGIGEKVGAPGLDKLAFSFLDRLGFNVGTGPMPETTLPWNIKEIAGTWSGMSDVDGTVWRFTFEENLAVRVSSSSGYFYDGTAFVHWKLGLTEGHLRVPPGWNVLDVDTINSAEPSHRNKVSLGAYSLQRNLLKYCFGEPGKMVRPIKDMSYEGIRCFELAKGTDGAGGSVSEVKRLPIQQGVSLRAETQTSQTGLSAAAPAKSIEGRAEVLIDGSGETWPLRTDRDSETSFADPHRLTLQFQAHGAT
ncbi:MAG TPA: hypothetical protein VN328_10190, partial [Thermodesulfovibrionales bacterium]|nr:hypothetical protein [Thermodesulfovibrionales bacterium]